MPHQNCMFIIYQWNSSGVLDQSNYLRNFSKYIMGNAGPSGFGSSSTAEEVIGTTDYSGKVIIITGSNTGISKRLTKVSAKKLHVFLQKLVLTSLLLLGTLRNHKQQQKKSKHQFQKQTSQSLILIWVIPRVLITLLVNLRS